MLKRLLSTTVTIAFLVSGAAIALEALGVLFQARSDDSERQRMEAFIARIEARFDPASPVEPATPVDLPSTPEAEQLRQAAGRGMPEAAPDGADEAPPAVEARGPQDAKRQVADIQVPAPLPEREDDRPAPVPIPAAAEGEVAPRPLAEKPAPVEADTEAKLEPEPNEPEPAPEARAEATPRPASPEAPEPAPAARIAAAAPAPAAPRRRQACTTGRCARPVAARRGRSSARRTWRRPSRSAGLFHCPLLGWLQ